MMAQFPYKADASAYGASIFMCMTVSNKTYKGKVSKTLDGTGEA